MTAVERLAAALDCGYTCCATHDDLADDMSHQHVAETAIRVDPTIAADLDFGAAWRRVEAALPDGWKWDSLDNFPEGWAASALAFDGYMTGDLCDTPTVALTALAEALEARP